MIALVRKGFALADTYQIPVFILTDQYFADSVQITEEDISLDVAHREYREFDSSYQRYRLTDDGISPLACPGVTDATVRQTSDEHDEGGRITEDSGMRIRMMDKRLGKRTLMEKDAVMPTLWGTGNASSFILCWGSSKLIVKEAAERLAGEGIRVGVLHFGQVYPLIPEMVAAYQLSERTLICVENNAGGQFSHLLQSELGLSVDHSVLKYDGDCFTVDELYRTLRGLLS
jgi:2-oxoglutarate ferredoxin oxidoreductase subunit alpha